MLLLFGFCVSINAQELKAQSVIKTGEKSAKEIFIEDVEAISKIVVLEASLKKDLTTLLHMRKDDIENAATLEEKKVIFERYTSKFLSPFSDEQIEKLKQNKELYTRITQFISN